MNTVGPNVDELPASAARGNPGARPADQQSQIVRQTALLTFFSFISPTLGLLSEAALAWKFGTTGIVDAYRITVLLILYGQQIFITAILPFVLVPIFAECRSRGREEEAWAVADAIAQILLVFGFSISLILFFRPDMAIHLIAPGLSAQARETATYFIRWCGLGFLPICWTGAACGILYSFNVIQVGAISQVVSNLVMVLAIVLGGGRLGANSLIIGVLGGAVASTAICTYKLRQIRRKFAPANRVRVSRNTLWGALSLAGPLVGAIVVGQGTSVVINRALSNMAAGSLALFGYAVKMGILVQLAPNAITTVLFPKVSESWFSDDRASFGSLCAKAVRAGLFISIPLTCICFAVQTSIIEVLLGRGAFHANDIRVTGMLFGLMIVGAPASTVVISLSRAFYASHLTRFPVMANVGGNLCEVAFIPLLATRFGLAGVAFGYMLLPWITGSGLLLLFIRKNQVFPIKSLVDFSVKTALNGIVCAWLAEKAAHLAADSIGSSLLRAIVMILVTSVLTAIGYFAGTLMLGLPEAHSLQEIATRLSRKAHRQLQTT